MYHLGEQDDSDGPYGADLFFNVIGQEWGETLAHCFYLSWPMLPKRSRPEVATFVLFTEQYKIINKNIWLLLDFSKRDKLKVLIFQLSKK